MFSRSENMIGTALTIVTQTLFFTAFPYICFHPDMLRYIANMFQQYECQPWVFYSVATSLLTTLPWLLCLAFFAFVAWARSPIFEQYRISAKELPYFEPVAKGGPEYRQLVFDAFKGFLVDHFNATILTALMFKWLCGHQTWENGFELWIQSIPPLHTMFLQLFGGCVLFDTLFYFGHRLAHLPIFYQFHKQHHLFTYPCALTGTYLSPVDSVFIQSLFPCFFSAYVFNMHLVTFWMFTILHITHSAYDHCGYEFPFSPFSLIPFAGHVRPHNFHHTHIVGNFAIYFRFWDWLFGTDQAYLLFEKERMQKQMLANQDAAQYSSGTDTDSDRRPRRRTSQPCPRSPSSKQ